MNKYLEQLSLAGSYQAYWEDVYPAPKYQLETIFPDRKQIGRDMKYIVGMGQKPAMLSLYEYNSNTHYRGRGEIALEEHKIPMFKESLNTDESLMADILTYMENGNSQYIESVLTKVYDDKMILGADARATRELQRCQALSTGMTSMSSGGTSYVIDYNVPAENKVTVGQSWSDPTSDPIKDLRKYKKLTKTNGGVVAMMNSKTFEYLYDNSGIKADISKISAISDVSENEVMKFVENRSGVTIVVIDETYIDKDGVDTQMWPDEVVSLFPLGPMGETIFATTIEEQTMNMEGAPSTAIIDTGVAVITELNSNPFNYTVTTTMATAPSMPKAGNLVIIDTEV